MKRGEKWVLALTVVIVISLMVRNYLNIGSESAEPDKGIPFYSTASPELTRVATQIYQDQNCKRCHSLWTIRNMLESVPAPALDGIGSLREEDWLYNYLSSPNPQEILPSRLKQQYKMPSFAHLTDDERKALAAYLASLKVEDWYLEETRKAEYEKLTGKAYSQ